MPEPLEDVFEDKARAGDGQFAIAYALLRLAGSHEVMTKDLCFGSTNTPGTLEKIGIELGEMAEALKAISQQMPEN